MDGKMTLVYGLGDPRTGALRYIGKTTRTINVRLRGHLAPSALKARTHKNAWLRNLIAVGLRPDCFVIEESDDECFWIAYFRAIGCSLTNGTAGGEGLVDPSTSVRRRMSEQRSGKALSVEHKQNIRLALLGKPRSREARKNISAGHRGKRKSSAHREAISASIQAWWASRKEGR